MTSSETVRFIERMETFGAQAGLPRSAARTLGYLSICEPATQTADEISQALKLSSGSVSTALALLRRTGLINRTVQPGDRHHYYELDSDGWRRATMKQFLMMKEAIKLVDQGLQISPHSLRLTSMRDIFILFDEEFERMADRLKL